MERRTETPMVNQGTLQGNDLLRRLGPESVQRLMARTTPVTLKSQEIIYRPGERISDIYFPETSVLCMLTIMADGRSIESATVGSEGASWVSASLGSPTMPCQTMVSVGGRAYKIGVKQVEEELRQNGLFHDRVSEYAHALLISTLRTGACNGLHSLTERSARWMLMTLDRTADERLQITQEFLAALLGCGRPTLSTILAELERMGAVHTSRGMIEITGRAGLLRATCECYALIRETFRELRERETKLRPTA